MQSLDVIAVNIWDILISLCNLLLLFLILKHFLYKPVKKMLASRSAAVDEQYRSAEEAEKRAAASEQAWAEKLGSAKDEADALVSSAKLDAERRSEKIVAEAKDKADMIVRRAEDEAELARRRAGEDMKREIVDVSADLAEKLLGREINEDDHRALIDDFVQKIGESDDAGE